MVDGADASEDPVTSKKSSKSKKDGSVASKRKRGKKGHSEDPDLEVEVNGIEPEDPAMVFLDLPKWKKEREELDKSFDAAKALFTSHGPWKLPPGVPPDKFSEIALATLAKMDKYVNVGNVTTSQLELDLNLFFVFFFQAGQILCLLGSCQRRGCPGV